MTQERIIEEIKRIAQKLGKNQLSLSEFRSNSDISDWHIWKLFASWNEAVQKAGLTLHTEKAKIAEDDLFIEMERVFLDCSGICNRTRFAKLASYSVDVYKNRFGGRWNNILMAFQNWLKESNREFPFIDQLPDINDAPLPSDLRDKVLTRVDELS
ncbi:TPA: hypothetical protein ENS27_15545 [bacterium]|nr:hypothetical protein [bacterium]